MAPASSSASSSPSSSRATTPEPEVQTKRSKSKSQALVGKKGSKGKAPGAKSFTAAAAAAVAVAASPARKRKAPEPEPELEDSDDSESDAEEPESGDMDDNSGSDDDDEDEREKKREEGGSDSESDDEDKESGDDDDEKMDQDSDEPVLSHAERRRRKKEAKKLASDRAPASKKQKLANGTSKDTSSKKTDAPAAVRKNSVWVGNMSFKTTPENLKAFFKDVGGEVTRVHMPMKAATKPGLKPENRGFAYVDFETPEAQKAAVALSENPLLGRKLLIKIGDDFAGRPAPADLALKDPALIQKTHSKTAQKILRAQKQPPAPTLFFGNLGFETTEEAIRELLEAHRPVQKPPKKSGAKKVNAKKGAKDEEDESGSDDEDDEVKVEKKAVDEEGKGKPAGTENWIRKIRMGTFEDTGKCKGFAFVDFVSIEHATACLINPQNHRLNGRQLVVEYAGAEAVRRGAPKGQKTPVNNGAAVASTSTSRRQVGAAGGGDGHKRNAEGSRPPFHRDGRRAGEVSEGHSTSRGGGGGRPAAKEDKVISVPVLPLVGGSARADGENDLGEGVPSGGSSRRQWEGQMGESTGYKKNGFGKGDRNGPAGNGGYNGKSRPKPGAALALAKRESAAIIPSQGSKITF